MPGTYTNDIKYRNCANAQLHLDYNDRLVSSQRKLYPPL